MRDVNKFIFTGRVGGEPTRMVSKTGAEFCKLGIAVAKTKAEDDGTYGVNWFNVVFFGNVASKYIIPYVHKGDRVIVECEIDVETFENENGETKRFFNFVGKDINIIQSKSNADNDVGDDDVIKESDSVNEDDTKETKEGFEPVDGDDLPF